MTKQEFIYACAKFYGIAVSAYEVEEIVRVWEQQYPESWRMRIERAAFGSKNGRAVDLRELLP